MRLDLMTPEMHERLLKWIEDDQLVKFYATREWRTIRLIALRRDKRRCQYAKRLGGYMKADTVHHIIAVRDDPSLALLLANLESISKSNHNKEHPEKFEENIKYLNEERW